MSAPIITRLAGGRFLFNQKEGIETLLMFVNSDRFSFFISIVCTLLHHDNFPHHLLITTHSPALRSTMHLRPRTSNEAAGLAFGIWIFSTVDLSVFTARPIPALLLHFFLLHPRTTQAKHSSSFSSPVLTVSYPLVPGIRYFALLREVCAVLCIVYYLENAAAFYRMLKIMLVHQCSG